MAKRKTKKKTSSKKTKEKDIVNEEEINEEVNVENIEEIEDIEEVNMKTNDDLITEIENLSDTDIKAKLLNLQNENVELKATIEKARKKLRIYSKKLDLSEEKEEQWKIACYSIAGMFAEKSQVSLDDILKKFEAPVDGISI